MFTRVKQLLSMLSKDSVMTPWCHLYVDNFYTSSHFFRDLFLQGVGACSIMGVNRGVFPKTTENNPRGSMRWIRINGLLCQVEGHERLWCVPPHIQPSLERLFPGKWQNEAGGSERIFLFHQLSRTAIATWVGLTSRMPFWVITLSSNKTKKIVLYNHHQPDEKITHYWSIIFATWHKGRFQVQTTKGAVHHAKERLKLCTTVFSENITLTRSGINVPIYLYQAFWTFVLFSVLYFKITKYKLCFYSNCLFVSLKIVVHICSINFFWFALK